MDARMIEKAIFLMREAHTSRQETVRALKNYFPGAAFEDRLRCVHEAADIAQRGAPQVTIAPSALSDARCFAAAHARHAFTD